jgi:hypothetical protein
MNGKIRMGCFTTGKLEQHVQGASRLAYTNKK